MKRRLLIFSVMTLTLVCALSAESPAEARRCPFDLCVTIYNECEASCNGNRQCVKACKQDYYACLCDSNCGYSCGPLPRTEPQGRDSRAAFGHGAAEGYAPALPADAFFRRERAKP